MADTCICMKSVAQDIYLCSKFFSFVYASSFLHLFVCVLIFMKSEAQNVYSCGKVFFICIYRFISSFVI